MDKLPQISVEDVRDSHVQVILGNSYVVQGDTLSPLKRFTQDRVLVLAALVLVLALVWPAFGPAARATHGIDPSFVHLGDNIFNPDYCRGKLGDVPIPLFPSGLVYANMFNTYLIRSKHDIQRDVQLIGAELQLYANEVDSTSPVTVTVNGDSIGYLNQFFMPDDSCQRRFVRMPIPISLLQEGDNIVVIEVGPKAVQTPHGDYEDMVFDHLAVDLLFRRELSPTTASKERIIAIGMSLLTFLLVLLGPLVYRETFASNGWRFFAALLSASCAVATVMILF